jgi:hypothetical protein
LVKDGHSINDWNVFRALIHSHDRDSVMVKGGFRKIKEGFSLPLFPGSLRSNVPMGTLCFTATLTDIPWEHLDQAKKKGKEEKRDNPA